MAESNSRGFQDYLDSQFQKLSSSNTTSFEIWMLPIVGSYIMYPLKPFSYPIRILILAL